MYTPHLQGIEAMLNKQQVVPSVFLGLLQTLKLQAVSSYQKSVDVYQTTRRYIPEASALSRLPQTEPDNQGSLFIV
jgi:hypothetical protein